MAEKTEVTHCYFCFKAADRQIGKYDLCIPCHYKFEDAIDGIDGLVLEILERASFRAALDRHRAEPEDDCTVPCERCQGTGARHVAGEPTQEPCGECSGEGVVCKPETQRGVEEVLP